MNSTSKLNYEPCSERTTDEEQWDVQRLAVCPSSGQHSQPRVRWDSGPADISHHASFGPLPPSYTELDVISQLMKVFNLADRSNAYDNTVALRKWREQTEPGSIDFHENIGPALPRKALSAGALAF